MRCATCGAGIRATDHYRTTPRPLGGVVIYEHRHLGRCPAPDQPLEERPAGGLEYR
jgi:hypothetical protein